ncbi:hypothetical protein HCZ30_04300 [Marivivens donghaensis]|uniref:Metal-dependent hydrolase n=1 Tax=Marivivens donghaensis TaxID=1699413 RepID=A0ABX0VUD1_9RHOB|nr:hypothetical protein [Marivivens donghaensis]NIY71654.1 hypothetical protein [Marivivens donghaensis]
MTTETNQKVATRDHVLLRWLRAVLSFFGQLAEATVVRLALMVLMAWVYLDAPDLDLSLMSVLHHRSIITHSLLPALVFLIFRREVGAAPLAGAIIGISVHMSCDMLSPMVGYGQIWLPAPFKMPLGFFSYFWIAGNALGGYFIAYRLMQRYLPEGFGKPVFIVLAGAMGAYYGIENEGYLGAFVIATLVPLLVAIHAWRGRSKV